MKDFNLRNYLYNNPLLEEKEEVVNENKLLKEDKLRGYIRERITSILKEAETEEEDVDVDVDVEDTEDVDVDIEKEVDVEDEEVESDIEVKTEVPGEDTDTVDVLGLLTKAQEEAEKLGDEKLMDQIGNTITYFTRAHVVKSINEAKSETGINMVKKKLDALGVKYEMSKTDKVRPFKVIYKPINKSDQFYDKFEDIVDLFNLKGVVKSINKIYGNK